MWYRAACTVVGRQVESRVQPREDAERVALLCSNFCREEMWRVGSRRPSNQYESSSRTATPVIVEPQCNVFKPAR